MRAWLTRENVLAHYIAYLSKTWHILRLASTKILTLDKVTPEANGR
jgi:hypothetical protein